VVGDDSLAPAKSFRARRGLSKIDGAENQQRRRRAEHLGEDHVRPFALEQCVRVTSRGRTHSDRRSVAVDDA